MAYVTKYGWCGQAKIPTIKVNGAVENFGGIIQAVFAGTCADYGYPDKNGVGEMDDPDSNFKG